MRNKTLAQFWLWLAVVIGTLSPDAVAQRWGVPGKPSSSDWTLTKPYAGRSAGSAYGRRTYSSAPARRQYSRPPFRHGYSYGAYPHAYGYNYNLYGSGRGFSGPGFSVGGIGALKSLGLLKYGYPYGVYPYGGFGLGHSGIYPGIYTPPIVVPFGLQSSASYSTLAVPSGAASSTLGFGKASPVPSVIGQPAPVINTDDQNFSLPIPVDQTPIHKEFGTGGPLSNEPVSAVDRIRSLRYQTSGDSAFRRKDYASAAALYQAAAETAPNRRPPALRHSWALIALGQFPQAVEQLKRALTLPSDGTEVWINIEDLYGPRQQSLASLHNNELWRWVQQRPASTDRLLLSAAFQKLRGYDGVSREVLRTAADLGLDQTLVDAMTALRPPPDPPVAEVEPEDGIRMRGSEVNPVPQPVEATDSRPPSSAIVLPPGKDVP